MAIRIIVAFFLSLIAFALWAATTQTTQEPHTLGGERGVITRVIDGDTLVFDNDQKVRLIGIDAPELTSSTQTGCFALESKSRAEQLLLHKQVRLVRDTSDVDQYNRLLRYVYIDDPLSSIHEETSINEILVHEGVAEAVAFPPDTTLYETLSSLEQDAKEKELGMWGSCE